MTRKVPTNGVYHSATGQNSIKDPIAIVGIGCRFPGGVDSPEKFWSLLYNGINTISEIPSDRIDVNTYYDPHPATPGKMMTRWGGFLENIDKFDAEFFGISPREADRMDPQQRLLLEVAWDALEDAGHVPSRLPKSKAGVFVGLWLNDYEARMFTDPSAADFYMTTGSGRYSASGRISYFLGLQGPSITIDTACSSSLVAVNLACQSIWNNQCSIALAGGANVILQPHISIAYSQSRMMAPDGRCKFGDALADGYVRSEGAGLVVLKPLSKAIADHDSVYAVIRGGAVNNDGSSSGFLATPSQDGQAEMLRTAYRDADILPAQVQYVEAHGTGTRAGDPIEIGALGKVLGYDRSDKTPLLVGSVKTNLGHTEGAAGIAGLIKVALSLKNRAIPPSLHLNELNPNIPWQQLNLTIPKMLTKLATDGEIIAGVSAFGITGTNAHMILATVPMYDPAKATIHSNRPFLLPLSAHTPKALATLIESYRELLNRENAPSLQDICFTAGLRRAHHSERLALAGTSHQEFVEQLLAHSKQKLQTNTFTGQNKVDDQAAVVFVFPGQGSQWLGMGRDLFEKNNAFQETLTLCDDAIQQWADWSLLEQLMLDQDSPAYRLNEISVIQPVLFAIEVALAAVWRSWGIEPSAVIGHSMGEVAAAYIAGALSLVDAARVICLRSQLMQRTSGQGAMAVVGLSFSDAEKVIVGYDDKLSVAVHNSPRSTVLSGDPDALAMVMEKLESQEVFCRKVNVDVASHSPQMDPLRPELVRSLDGIQPQLAEIQIYSTVLGEVQDGKALDAEYWGRNLRQPVRFSEMVQNLLSNEQTIFIEMSTHPLLLTSIQETGYEMNKQAYTIPSLQRNGSDTLEILRSLGILYETGYSIDWKKIYPSGKLTKLPLFPWQRQRYWYDNSTPNTAKHDFAGKIEHALLGIRLPGLAHMPDHYIWQNKSADLRKSLPEGDSTEIEAVYREMALAATNLIVGNKNHAIYKFTNHEILSLNTGPDKILQTSLIQNGSIMTFQLFSRTENGAIWQKHTTVEIQIGNVEADWFYDLSWEIQDLKIADSDNPNVMQGSWLILADHLGIGEKLASRLKEQGVKCQVIFSNNETIIFDDLLDRLESPLRIIYLWGLDLATNEQITAESLVPLQVSGSQELLSFVQTIIRHRSAMMVKLWCVTRGAQSILSNEEPQLSQATLWGLAKVANLEQSDLWQGIVDLPTGKEVQPLVDFLWTEICHPSGDDQIAYRDGHRYVPRLTVAHHIGTITKAFNLSADGTYLITGGLGRLGLQICQWLADQGARHLVLTSRDRMPDRAEWASIAPDSKWGYRLSTIRTLEEKGIRIDMVQADVTDEFAMQELFNQFGQSLPVLRGVIHAAGIMTNQTLTELDLTIWRNVLAPKVKGGWILHKLTTNIPLDFFVCFSSAASVWGSQGMAHYGAANHFLDQLAFYRRAHHLPALTVNWGWWSGKGIATDEQENLFAKAGLSQMPIEKALAALKFLIEIDLTQQVVADVDWAVFKPIYESTRERRFLSRIETPKSRERAISVSKSDNDSILQQLRDASLEKQKEILSNHVSQLVAEILGFGVSQSVNTRQGFFKMGMDSLMTVQLRTRLEASLDCMLPPTIAFEYPSINDLIQYLLNHVLQTSDESSDQMETIESNITSGDQQLDSLSEDEVLSLLDSELAKVDDLTKDGKLNE